MVTKLTRREKAARIQAAAIRDYERKTSHGLTKAGRQLLDSVSTYLYGEAQKAATLDQRDEWSLTLAIVGAVRRGSTLPFQDACIAAFGATLERYQSHRNKQRWLAKREWFAAMPDYDPEEARRVEIQKNYYQKQTSESDLVSPVRAKVVSIGSRAPDENDTSRGVDDGTRRTTPKRRDARALRASSQGSGVVAASSQ